MDSPRKLARVQGAALDELQQEGLGARTVSTAIARNRVQVGVTGDRGGPVFAANSAYGIISGNATYSDGNQDAIYSNIQLVQQALGVKVRTCCR